MDHGLWTKDASSEKYDGLRYGFQSPEYRVRAARPEGGGTTGAGAAGGDGGDRCAVRAAHPAGGAPAGVPRRGGGAARVVRGRVAERAARGAGVLDPVRAAQDALGTGVRAAHAD